MWNCRRVCVFVREKYNERDEADVAERVRDCSQPAQSQPSRQTEGIDCDIEAPVSSKFRFTTEVGSYRDFVCLLMS